ncbi:MAG: hypothetical protein A2927_01065 [Candidatus Komeilibacteria bacterium RIFCSPLOWO2_01_FULL_45_10]|uniref:Uncharacterized protein n=1 Tax=Candidatus Komeilibacteria bacterium RIFCSPLOWO2_01_FULL_45_10 TaxID=1798550 RepID=A0A1G2BL02_9BACT|nr:MAG: hypothetical protein A2927_01065 [Candidatus Komeilibacteria bacterium RIFCSPLOWO2_01_FULL_45_10]
MSLMVKSGCSRTESIGKLPRLTGAQPLLQEPWIFLSVWTQPPKSPGGIGLSVAAQTLVIRSPQVHFVCIFPSKIMICYYCSKILIHEFPELKSLNNLP